MKNRKTAFFASGRLTYRYFELANTQFGSLLSQIIENQQIMSAKYTVLMLRLHQNERYTAFGMVASGTSVIRAVKQFDCSSVIVHSLVRRYEQTGISIDACSRSNMYVRKRRRDNTVNLLLRIKVSSSSRQL